MEQQHDQMPRNLVGTSGSENQGGSAGDMGISEEEWRAENLPAEKITLRWRYAHKEIQLYERRLRSLKAYNVGPAVQAWVRSRLEWVVDNKLYEKPDGVVVLSIDPEGDVDIQLEDLVPPARGCAGTMWVAEGSLLSAVLADGELRTAADTLVRDLATTLGYHTSIVAAPPAVLDEAFIVSDEFGVVPMKPGPTARKMQECFEKVYA